VLRALARGSRDARRASRLGAAPCAGCSAVWPVASACAVHAASAHGGWPRCGEAVTRHGVSRGVCCGPCGRVSLSLDTASVRDVYPRRIVVFTKKFLCRSQTRPRAAL
jgi:hypothetical protein